MFEEDTRDGGNVLVEMVCARARPNEIFTRHVRQIALDFEVERNRKEGQKTRLWCIDLNRRGGNSFCLVYL